MHCATVPISFGCCEVNGSVADGTVWKIYARALWFCTIVIGIPITLVPESGNFRIRAFFLIIQLVEIRLHL
jgi:hypothetical protein